MDTAILHEVLAGKGPFASVHLDATHDSAGAARKLDLRWRAARAELIGQGAPATTLAALDEAIGSRPPAVGRAGRFLVAAGDTVLVDEYLSEVPPVPLARFSPLPYLLPLAGSGSHGVTYAVALVDKTGARLWAVDADGTELARYTVEGREHPVHKVGHGGWSHRNIQRHAEDTVKHNVAEVAREAAQLVRRTGARLLVLAGEVEPRAMLRRALPPSCDQIAVEVESGSRAAGDDGQALARDVRLLVAEQARAERDELLEQFRAELRRSDGLAVQGLRPTTEALREANVATLVVGDLHDATVWTGGRAQVALEPDDLDATGAGADKVRGRADEALPAAAIVTGAEVLATEDVDLPLADGVGALLRHG